MNAGSRSPTCAGPSPTTSAAVRRAATPDRLIAAIDLVPGSLLYLPRGYVHEGTANEHGASAHLTIGIRPMLLSSVLVGTINKLAREDVRLRRSMPPGFLTDKAARSRAEELAAEAIGALWEALSPTALVDNAATGSRRLRPPALGGHLVDLEALRTLTPDSRVRRRPGLAWHLDLGDRVDLQFHGKSVRFPGHVSTEVTFAAAGEPFAPCDIPGALDEPGRMVLVTTLVREGFLTLA
jgi:cupin superfamily protein